MNRLLCALFLVSVAVRARGETEIELIRKLSADWQIAAASQRVNRLVQELEREGKTNSAEYASALTELARVNNRNSKPIAESLQIADRAIALEINLGGVGLAETWTVHGSVQFAGANYRKATEDFEKALALEPDNLDAKNGLGQALAALGETKRATQLHQDAIQFAEKRYGAGDRRVGNSYYQLGNALRIAGRTSDAEAAFTQALTIFSAQPPGSEVYVGEAKQSLGVVYREQGHSERALPLMLDAVKIYDSVLGKQHRKLIPILNNAGLAANSIGNYPLAVSCFGRTLEIVAVNGMAETSVGATVRGNYGILLRDSGNFRGAREQYETALKIQERILGKEHPLVASIRYSLGIVLEDLGDLKEAELVMRQASETSEKVLGPNHLKTLEAKSARAILLSNLGREAEARALAKSTLAAAETHFGDDSNVTAGAVDALAQVERKSRHYEEARNLITRYIKIHKAADAKDTFWVASPYLELAVVEQELGHSEVALGYTDQFDTLSRVTFGSQYPRQAEMLETRARALQSLGQRKKAFDAALASCDVRQSRLRELTGGLAEREALALSEKDNNPWNVAFRIWAENKAGATEQLDSEGREGGQLDGTDLAVARLWDRLVKNRAVVLDAMSERSHLAHMQGGAAAQAREVAQAREDLARAALATPSGGAKVYAERFRALRVRLEEAERNLARASISFERVRAEEMAGFAEIARALPSDSALIAYTQSDTRMVAFTLAAGKKIPTATILGDAAAIDRAVKNWRAAIDREAESFGRISPAADAFYRDVGTALRRLIWDPVISSVAGAKRMYLVPSGMLQFVNFETLPVGKQRYLAESGVDIRVIGAERDLAVAAKDAGKGELLAMGNPAYSGKMAVPGRCGAAEFEPLPGSAAEARAVAANWRAHGGAAVELQGARASKAALLDLAPGKRVVHLATHGFLLPDHCKTEPGFDENPLLRSGLVLAGSGTDGILTAEEAASLNLDGTQLVVLSGCETGAGVLRLGEGVLGFRRAFRIAGADTIVSSLWPVGDRDTEGWMSAFYLRFARGATPQESAHYASISQLTARRKNGQSSNPFYWGAFLAVGVR